MARNLISTDAQIDKAARAAKAGGSKRLSDGEGLYLLLFADGGDKHGWRFDYTFEGKRKTLSLGTFDTKKNGRAKARAKADKCRLLLSEGTNPSDLRKAERKAHQADDRAKHRAAKGLPAEGSLKGVAILFHDHKSKPDANGCAEWSDAYAKKFRQVMELNVYPWLGDKPIQGIAWREVLQVCERAQNAGKRELAHTLRMYCDQVWQFALQRELVEWNIVKRLSGMLLKVTSRRMSAIIDPKEVATLVRGIDEYNGALATRTALLLSLHTFQRPFNIRAAQWSHFDLDAAVWTIPTKLMKGKAEQKLNGRDHVVPLSRQVVAALADLKPLTGHREYVFPSQRGDGRPMSENTVNLALRNLGFTKDQLVAHGLRATARTLLAERVRIDGMPVNEAWIEAQLAHEKSGPLGDAYDRAKFIEQRVMLMQAWSDYLDGLRALPSIQDAA